MKDVLLWQQQGTNIFCTLIEERLPTCEHHPEPFPVPPQFVVVGGVRLAAQWKYFPQRFVNIIVNRKDKLSHEDFVCKFDSRGRKPTQKQADMVNSGRPGLQAQLGG